MPYADPADEAACGRRWYEDHKQVYLDRNRTRREEKRAYLTKLKEDAACARCGGRFPAVAMDFHHSDAATKDKDVSALVSYGWRRLLEEIAKCEIVCANCHRILGSGVAEAR